MNHDVLNTRQVDLSLSATSWSDAVAALSLRLWREGRISSVEEFTRALADRERIGSTYCGRQLAVPHATSSAVRTPSLCIGRSPGFPWQAPEEWVRLVFLLAIPAGVTGADDAATQVGVLTAISVLAVDEKNVQCWIDATSADQIVESILGALPPVGPKPRDRNRKNR